MDAYLKEHFDYDPNEDRGDHAYKPSHDKEEGRFSVIKKWIGAVVVITFWLLLLACILGLLVLLYQMLFDGPHYRIPLRPPYAL